LQEAHGSRGAFWPPAPRVSTPRFVEVILEFVNDALLTFDRDGRVISCSGSSIRMFGWSTQEIIGKPWGDLVAENARADIGQAVNLAWLGQPSERVEAEGRRRDGIAVPLWCTVAPVPVTHGAVTEILIVAQDRTESQLYESTLAASDIRLRESEALARMGTWAWDALAGTVQWSAGLHMVRGVDPMSFEGTLGSHLAQILSDDREAVELAMRAAANDGPDFESEYRISVEGDGIRWLYGRARRARDTAGRTVGLWGVEQDVTERQLATQVTQVAHDRAEQASRAKTDFLSRMSHELRTPLNAILGFSQLLTLGPLAAEQAEDVEHISRAGQHLLGLIDEVLDLARIESGEMTLAVAPTALAPIVAGATELVASMACERGVTIEEPQVPDSTWVIANQQRLRQVLVNLLANAIKFNREGGTVTLGVEARPDEVSVSVSDTGVGIAADKLARLFKPFDRLGAQSGVEGSGLGLALSRELLELMGGTIEVDSQPGVGSTFTVRLPSSVTRTETPSALVLASCGSGIKERLRAIGTLTVVYVEDNPVNALVMERILAISADIRLIVATRGHQAVSLCQLEHPDIILLDLQLPDESGTDVLIRLRVEDETAHVPVVIVSADADQETIKAHLKLGAADYLSKPIRIEELVNVLARCQKGDL
jgi:PAS domain S-box-containing protein